MALIPEIDIIRILLIAAVLVAQICNSEEEWRWNNNERSAQSRYDVIEESDETLHGPVFRPPLQPINQKPIHQDGYFDQNFQRPGPNNPGILTGPVPSWQNQPHLEKFDRCKCAESFNCNTPGISYGHCDTGKQYCCYRSKRGRFVEEEVPSRPVHSIENGILAGPGGPVDFGPGLLQQNRPGLGYFPGRYDRNQGNGYSVENGVLSGPGGPVDFRKRSVIEDDSQS